MRNLRGRAMAIGLAASLLGAGIAPWAHAWGPRTRGAMVTTAVHIVSDKVGLPLGDRTEDVQAGALAPEDKFEALFPGYARDPLSAIEVEMRLLTAAGGKVDRYYAYRLGMLGRLVADYLAPMRTAPPTFRDLYYADVDKRIGTVALKVPELRPVEISIYFSRIAQAASANDSLILRDYSTGTGFPGVAAGLLPKDALRAASAIADVWYTILASGGAPGNVSDVQLQQYVMGAYEYYIQNGKTGEIKIIADRLDALTPPTADMRVKLGDLLLSAQEADRAMAAYRDAQRMDPDRRDVSERMAKYYIAQGNNALGENRLDEALSAFESALSASPGEIEAETGRLDAVHKIEEREARLSEDRAILEQAAKYEEMGEQEEAAKRYAEAIALLRQALAEYNRIRPESVAEYARSRSAVSNIGNRIQDLEQSIMENAQAYSGKGFSLDIPVFVKKSSNALDRLALQALIDDEYEARVRALEKELGPALQIQP